MVWCGRCCIGPCIVFSRGILLQGWRQQSYICQTKYNCQKISWFCPYILEHTSHAGNICHAWILAEIITSLQQLTTTLYKATHAFMIFEHYQTALNTCLPGSIDYSYIPLCIIRAQPSKWTWHDRELILEVHN